MSRIQKEFSQMIHLIKSISISIGINKNTKNQKKTAVDNNPIGAINDYSKQNFAVNVKNATLLIITSIKPMQHEENHRHMDI